MISRLLVAGALALVWAPAPARADAFVVPWFGHLVFWALVAYGWLVGELSVRRAAVFLALWVGGCLGLPYIPWLPAHVMFAPFVAILDIALVFSIFGGDVRLR